MTCIRHEALLDVALIGSQRPRCISLALLATDGSRTLHAAGVTHKPLWWSIAASGRHAHAAGSRACCRAVAAAS
eukprot:12629781-Alexandrium_andersonii.AAC.1